MDFALTEEQEMIRESAENFLADVSSSAAVREAMQTEHGYDQQVWQRICEEMVWPAIHIPEAYGGMGLGYVELAVLLEKMGKYLLCSPYFSTVCLGVNALLMAGTEQQKADYLPKIAEGQLTATLAYTGINGRWDAHGVQATYQKTDAGYLLNGQFRFVPDGHTADLLIVAAREEGSQGEQGVALFALSSEVEGVTRQWLPTMDQTRKQAEINLAAVSVDDSALMVNADGGWSKLSAIIQLAQIAVAAEQMGGAQQTLDMAVDYTQEREQFGRKIASYQAIKHKAADMMLKAEVARSAVYFAACVGQEVLAEQGDAELIDDLPQAASMAKAYCSDAFFFNAGNAIQFFGGVGFTWEYDCHLYFKRAKSTETFLGNASYHRELIAKQLLDTYGGLS
ncbi:MAG: acyl-CoA dehydrogenase family protein [Pseudomonadota bacterium]|nr:acyl-CoA dehydrogenase family protein [Pseudomonadota bacterium]